MKQPSFDATISALDAETSALDVETSAFGAATSAIARRSFDASISALDAETSSLDAETSALGAETSELGAATSAIARSYRRYQRGVYSNIGDCGVGTTPQMCNRVTNHGDMSTFSKPELSCKFRRIFYNNYINNFFRRYGTERYIRQMCVLLPNWSSIFPHSLQIQYLRIFKNFQCK